MIIPTLYKTFFFSIFLLIFEALEVTIRAFIKNTSLAGISEEFAHHYNAVFFAGLLVVGFTFIPFFAFKKLARYYGSDQFQKLFFNKKEQINTK